MLKLYSARQTIMLLDPVVFRGNVRLVLYLYKYFQEKARDNAAHKLHDCVERGSLYKVINRHVLLTAVIVTTAYLTSLTTTEHIAMTLTE